MSSDLLEFSELEMDRYDDFNILSRSLTEISADVNEVLTQLGGFMGRVDADIDEFTKLAHHLQDEITAARMVPIGNLYTRLTRTARDASKAAEKQVELALEGAETELDNNIIQHISDPLIHLVRNAVAHGIESADERLASGKPLQARVSVRAYHRGNHIFIEVEDDGRGIDYERIRQRVVESNAASPVVASQLSERELREYLFRPGFSTAAATSELAGRGVGLDVVRSNVQALNGEIEVRSETGRGACFTVKVPLTLIISQALFVRCGKLVFALPLAMIEEIRRLRAYDIEDVGGKLLTRVRDVVTEVVRLDLQLGLPPLEPTNGYFHMVIVKVAGKQVGRRCRRSAGQGRNRHQEPRRIPAARQTFPRHDDRAGRQPYFAYRSEQTCLRGSSGAARPVPGVTGGARFCAGRGGRGERADSSRSDRSRCGRTRDRGGGRFHQRSEICRTNAGEGRLPRAARLRRSRSGGNHRREPAATCLSPTSKCPA